MPVGTWQQTTRILALLTLVFVVTSRQSCVRVLAKDGTGLDKVTWSGTVRIEQQLHGETNDVSPNGETISHLTTTGTRVTEFQVEGLPHQEGLNWRGGSVPVHIRNSESTTTRDKSPGEVFNSDEKTEGEGNTTGDTLLILRGEAGTGKDTCWIEGGSIGQSDNGDPVTKPVVGHITNHMWGRHSEAPFDSTETKPTHLLLLGYRLEIPCERDAHALHGSKVTQDTKELTERISWDLTQDGEPRTEVEIVPPNDYDQWLPQAGETEKTLGNFIDVGIVAHTKGDPTLKPPVDVRKYTITLADTSRERGVDSNWPPSSKATDDYDMKLDSDNLWINLADDKGQSATTRQEGLTEFLVTVDSYDWGGYTKLKVVAELEDGTAVVAHVRGHADEDFLLLPKDDNQNHIADYWEHWFDLPNKGEAADDDDTPAGDGDKGDSIALYDEYRGFHIHGQHERLSPEIKDLFIWDVDQLGAGLYSQATGVSTHLIYGTERKTDDGAPNPNVANPNSTQQKFYAVKLQSGALEKGDLAVTDGGPVPKYVEQVTINVSGITSGYKGQASALPAAIAHELGHATNLDHHGEAPPDYSVGDVRCKQPDGTFKNYLCSNWPKGKNGKATGPGQAGSACFGVATQGGLFSGNDKCIMRYDIDNFFENPKGNCQWQHNGKTVMGSLYGQDPPGTTLCDSPRGTGVNNPYDNPAGINKAGDASPGRGDCIHKFCLNNSKHSPS